MEKVLNFARLVYDVSHREIKGEIAKNKVIEFLDSLGSPTEEKLNLFDRIIREQDFSILDKSIGNAPWRTLIEKSYVPDNYVLKAFTYYILTKRFYGDDDSEMDHLLNDIYAEEKAKGPGSELDRMDTIVWYWTKAIINNVFPFTKSVFTNDSDSELSHEEVQEEDIFMSLVRLAYVDEDCIDMSDAMLIKTLSNPEYPLYKEYSKERLHKFVKIAKDGNYRKLINSLGDMYSDENILSGWANISNSYKLSKEERRNLWEFAYDLQEMFGVKGDSPFDAFTSKMMD